MNGINLHALVRPLIAAVNPDQPVIILRSAGFEVVDFEQKPVWAPAVSVMAQPQPVPDKALQFLVQQRQNSLWHDFYLAGDWSGLRRATEQGGDLLYWNGFEWQVDQVLEAWAPTVGWTKVRCIQVRACEPPDAGATQPPAGSGEDGQ